MQVNAGQPKKRRTLIFRGLIAVMTTALFVSGTVAQAAPSPKAGAACSKAEAKVTVKSGKKALKLTCAKVKGHLIWVAAIPKVKKPVVAPAKLGGNFRVGVAALPTGKGNPFVGIGTPGIYTMAAIYDSLVTINEEGDLVPSLATKWNQTSDTSWTLTLRDGVTFSNGEKFDASSVVSTLSYLTQDPVGAKTIVAAEVNNISSVSGSGNTVTITTKTADSILPRKLTVVWMVAPKAWQTLGAAGYALTPIGTGPFTVTEWGATAISLQANKASWRSPKVDTMQVLQIPDPTARIQALQSGQIDLAVQVGPDETSEVDRKKFQVVYDSFPQVMSLAFITTKGDSPLLKKEVRLALNYAINRDSIVNNLLGGKGTAANQGSTKLVFGYNSNLSKYPYDPTKAKALLATAGFPTGFSISADVTVGSFPADADIYQAVARDLKRIGVTLLLRQIPFSEWLGLYSTNGWKGQAFGLSWNSNTLDARRAIGLFSCSGPGKFFCNEDMTPVLTEIDNASSESARKAALLKAAEINYNNPPALYIVGQVDINVLGSAVKGFKNVNRYFPYEKITVR
ncbi:MAG: ABC transporter substrate-binding protein [Candidatus Nanopelagicaceae bacterium]|jgi:peptide/nickel transport system substrate-binding protein